MDIKILDGARSAKSSSWTAEQALFLIGGVYTLLCFAATFVVLLCHLPPIFNQDFQLLKVLNLASIAGCGLATIVLFASASFTKLRLYGRVTILVLLVFIGLDWQLRIFDNVAVSVDHSIVPTALRQVHDGTLDLYLPQSNPESPIGLKWARQEPVKKHGYRVLMLGGSFVYGTGSSLAINYPQAVEAELRQRFPGRDISVVSGGVDGYGLAEDLTLYRYLTQQGYDFDAVVLSFAAGADPSNDIPGTFRRPIAGEAQRLHDSLFLRTFYPVDSYVMRYLIYLRAIAGIQGAKQHQPLAVSSSAICTPGAAFLSRSRERDLLYYGQGQEVDATTQYNFGLLRQIGEAAEAQHARFSVIVLPDRNAALREANLNLSGKSLDWLRIRNLTSQTVSDRWPMVDLHDSFFGRKDLFACNDVHWNDRGNLFAAHLVGNFLSNQIK